MLQNKQLITNLIEELNALIHTMNNKSPKLNAESQSLEETIDYLRLSIQYLLFDLEACRRENGILRQMLIEDDDPFC